MQKEDTIDRNISLMLFKANIVVSCANSVNETIEKLTERANRIGSKAAATFGDQFEIMKACHIDWS